MRAEFEPRKATLATLFVALMFFAPLATLGVATPVDAEHVPQSDQQVIGEGIAAPADHGTGDPFWKTLEGFSTKTGYRMVFFWEANEAVAGVVRWGYAPGALDNLARPVGQVIDTAGLAILDVPRGRVGETVYWEVLDQIDGTVSPMNSFRLGNAWTSDHDGDGVYTINALMQLDSESLPDDVPFDQGLVDLARGVDVFAERVWDMTDGHLRIGKVLITDTAAYHPGYQPQTVPVGIPPQCVVQSDDEAAIHHTLADFIVSTQLPFDSHTWGRDPPSIDHACTAFYIGRIGQLIVPWEDPAHLGYVMAHEFGHYAMGLPDLYNTEVFTDPRGCANRDPASPGYDASVMHNSGGWTGTRWDLTELDRAMGDCDRSVGTPEVSWDEFRRYYEMVPATTAADIDRDDSDPFLVSGNPDGGALDVFLMDQTPALSTTQHFIAAPRASTAGPEVLITTPQAGTEAAPTALEVRGSVNREGATNSGPVGTIAASPRDGPAPLDVTFTLGGSDAEGGIASWSLDFGDGAPAAGGSAAPPSEIQHTYSANGTYTATLTLTDDEGATGTAEAFIIVGNGGPRRIGTDPSGDAPTTGDCEATITCDHGWTAAATPGLDVLAAHVEDIGDSLRFAWSVSDATKFFVDPSGDPAADDPANGASHIVGYQFTTTFTTSAATGYSIDIRRERDSADLSATLSRVFTIPGIGSLSRPEPTGTTPQWSAATDTFWVDLPKELVPELAVVGEIAGLGSLSYVVHQGASVQLIVEKDNLGLIENDRYVMQSHADLIGAALPMMATPKAAPSTVPPGAQVVDATGDVTVAGLPVDHMDIEAAWFDNDDAYLYAGLKVKDIPVNVTTTSQVAYHVTFDPWTAAGWGVPANAQFTGLRLQALMSQVEFDGIPSVPTTNDGTHKFALQILYTDTTNRYGEIATLPASSLDPDTDIVWFVVPMNALQSPPPGVTLSELGADAVPAVKGAVTFGNTYGDVASGGANTYTVQIINTPLEVDTTGPYRTATGLSVGIEAKPQGGIAPYTCRWTTLDGGAFGDAGQCSTTVAFPTPGDKIIEVNVTDSEGNATSTTTLVSVSAVTDERVELRLSGELLGAAGVHTLDGETFVEWTRTVDLTGRSGEHTLTATWVDGDGRILDNTTIDLVVGAGPAAFVTVDAPWPSERVGGVIDVQGRAGHGNGDEGSQTVAFGPDGLFKTTSLVTRTGSIATFCATCEGFLVEGTGTLVDGTGFLPFLLGSVTWFEGDPGGPSDGIDGRWLDVSGFNNAEYRLQAAAGSPMDIWFFSDPSDAQSAHLGNNMGPDALKTGVVPPGANWAFVHMRRPTADPAPAGVNDEAILTLTPPLTAPQGLIGTAGWDTATLSWSEPEFAGADTIDHYNVYRDGTFLKTVTGTTATDSGLTPDVTYVYTVRAVNTTGVEGPQATAVSLTTGTDATAPNDLSNLAASGITHEAVSLTWDASTDAESGVAYYRIKRNNVHIDTVVGTSYDDQGLVEQTNYTYTVIPVNGQGLSGRGASVQATTTVAPVTENVSLFVGDTLIGTTSISTWGASAEWTIEWDTRTLADATYTLKAVYEDGRGSVVVDEIPVEVENIPADPAVGIDAPLPDAVKQTPIRFEGDFTTLGDQSAQPVSLPLQTQVADWMSDPWVRTTLKGTAYETLLATLSQLDGFLGAYPTSQDGRAIVVLLDGVVPNDAPTAALGVPVRYVTDVVPEPLRRPVESDESKQIITLAEFEQWSADYSGPATPGIQQGIGPGGAIQMRNADADGVLGTYGCTASYLFEDPFTGIYYLATAGHCLMDEGVTSSEANPEARSRYVDLCIANCVTNFGVSQVFNTFVRLQPNATYHPVTYAFQAGTGADFGLIEIPEELHEYLRPHLWFWGGPTQIDRPELGDPLAHYGHGLGVGATFATQGRLGVTIGSSPGAGIAAAGWVTGGDSGSAVGTAFPRDDEMLLGDGASGAITHSVQGIGLPVFWSTDMVRGLEMAGRPYLELVTEDAPIRSTRSASGGTSSGPVVFDSPATGATFDPLRDGTISVGGTIDLDPLGGEGTEWRTFYLHRSACGTGQRFWMDETHLQVEGGNGCGNTFHPAAPAFEAVFGPDFLAVTYPADPLPAEPITLDASRLAVADVYFSNALGTDKTTLMMEYTARLSYNGTIVAEQRQAHDVHIGEKVTVAMPILNTTVPAGAPLTFTFFVHSAAGEPLFFNYGGGHASNVRLPIAPPRDVAVEVSVGDPQFGTPSLLPVTGSDPWTASWDLTGLPYGKQTLYGRVLLDGVMLGDFTTHDVFLTEHVPVPPSAGFATAKSDLMVDFTDTSVAGDAPIVSWEWDFGDHSSSTVQNPTHTFPAPGAWPVTLTVTDADGLSNTTTRNVSVERGIIEYFVETRLVGPTGLAFNWTRVASAVEGEDGTWSLLWAPDAVPDGGYTLEARILRGVLPVAQTSTNFTVDNNVAPVFVPSLPQAVEELKTLVFDVVATDADPEDVLTLEATDLPAGAAFTDNGDGTGTVSWTPTSSQLGTHSASFSVSDGRLNDTTSVTISVFDKEEPPVLDPIGDFVVAEGQQLVVPITGSDLNGDVLSLTVSPKPNPAVVAKTGPGSWTFTWTPSYQSHGERTFTARLTDGTTTVERTFNVTVTDVDVAPMWTAAQSVSALVGVDVSHGVSAKDLDGDAVTLTASGLPSWATFIDNGAGRGTFQLSPPPHESGEVYRVVLTASSTIHQTQAEIDLTAYGYMELSLVPTGSSFVTASPGQARTLEAVLTNSGNAPGWVTFSSNVVRAGWTSDEPADLFLQPGEAQKVNVVVVPGDSGSSSVLSFRAAARDFGSVDALTQFQVRIPVRLAVTFTETSAVFGTTATVSATFLNDAPAPGVAITVTDVHELGMPFVNTASGTTDATGSFTFTFDMNSRGGQLPGGHTLYVEGVRDGRTDSTTTEYTVTV